MNSSEVLRYSAFSNNPQGGNPAGIVLDASGLEASQMLAIAAEVGYSETAFLFPRPDLGNAVYDIRYFSPEVEVPFCGHATIATGVALGHKYGSSYYQLNAQAGPITLSVSEQDGTFTAVLTSPPAAMKNIESNVLVELLKLLGWSKSELDDRFQPAIGFAGLNNHPVLVVNSRERLSILNYQFDDLKKLMQEQNWVTIQLVYPDEGDPASRLWHSRNPFPVGGVYEDPATGAAAAAFAGYLRESGLVIPGETFAIHQGEDMGRPSVINVKVGESSIEISGTAVRL
ncbi:MAG: PhzF family phenazine biosynthesis protein [Candidatus Nanopelagicaceae bacterium]|nr:PhzF family phenazine biosynthesis protein [Candidatus Nanopelagicaceae bacterium]